MSLRAETRPPGLNRRLDRPCPIRQKKDWGTMQGKFQKVKSFRQTENVCFDLLVVDFLKLPAPPCAVLLYPQQFSGIQVWVQMSGVLVVWLFWTCLKKS